MQVKVAAEYIGDINYAIWIEDLFMEIMRYVPVTVISKTDWVYYCLDCGEPTSSGLHCDKR